MKSYRELDPIFINYQVFDQVEARILKHFRDTIYLPVLAESKLPASDLLSNSGPADYQHLIQAINSGAVTFNRGQFSGKFNVRISRALHQIGARFDRKTQTFRLLTSELPDDLQAVVASSSASFAQKLRSVDERLAKILGENSENSVRFEDLFDKTIFQVDKEFRRNVRGISLTPELTDYQAKKISTEWQNNLDLWIQDFKAEQIQKLRTEVRQAVMAGNRYGSLIGSIQKSYEVSANKAKFLARQETKLMTTKYQESRYLEAGIPEYQWTCVTGTVAHPVRPWHKKLDGSHQRWDKPPVTTEPGQPERKNNPGQDYNCRCYAIPLVRF